MTEPRIIPAEEIEQYSLDEIIALQHKFEGCSFWSDDITHIDREDIHLTRDTLDAMDIRLDTLRKETNAQISQIYNDSAALCTKSAKVLCLEGNFEQAAHTIHTEYHCLPPSETANEARAHLETEHEFIVAKAKESGVAITPLLQKPTR